MWKTNLFLTFLFAMLLIAPFAYANCHTEGARFIPNPIQACTFGDLVQAIASAVTLIATPLAVVAIIFVGFKFITASVSGNQSELANAKKMLLWVLIGTAIVVGSAFIANAIVEFIKEIESNPTATTLGS